MSLTPEQQKAVGKMWNALRLHFYSLTAQDAIKAVIGNLSQTQSALEQALSNYHQREVQLKKALEELAAEKALREQAQATQLTEVAHELLATEYVVAGESHPPNLVNRAKSLIHERANLRAKLEQAQRERDEALAAISADTAAVVLAKCVLETERDELQTKLEARENEIDEEWLNAIAAHWNAFFGKPFDTRDGETREEGLQANVGAIFQQLDESRTKLLASEAAAAEMRRALIQCSIAPNSVTTKSLRDNALSTPCGTAFLAERKRMVEALEFYDDEKAWHQCIAGCDIGNEIKEGEVFMAFDKGEERPWLVARNVLKETK